MAKLGVLEISKLEVFEMSNLGIFLPLLLSGEGKDPMMFINDEWVKLKPRWIGQTLKRPIYM